MPKKPPAKNKKNQPPRGQGRTGDADFDALIEQQQQHNAQEQPEEKKRQKQKLANPTPAPTPPLKGADLDTLSAELGVVRRHFINKRYDEAVGGIFLLKTHTDAKSQLLVVMLQDWINDDRYLQEERTFKEHMRRIGAELAMHAVKSSANLEVFTHAVTVLGEDRTRESGFCRFVLDTVLRMVQSSPCLDHPTDSDSSALTTAASTASPTPTKSSPEPEPLGESVRMTEIPLLPALELTPPTAGGGGGGDPVQHFASSRAIHLPNGDRYFGDLLNGLPHGEGGVMVVSTTGALAMGTWRDGRLVHGLSSCQQSPRHVAFWYLGDFTEDMQPHGQGELESNGVVVKGHFEKGAFVEGELDEHSVIPSSVDRSQNLRAMVETILLRSGTKGAPKKGLPLGPSLRGDSLLRGELLAPHISAKIRMAFEALGAKVQGKTLFHTVGPIPVSDESSITYEGAVSIGFGAEGFGTKISESGSKRTGYFKDDKLHGQGEVHDHNGSKFIGTFVNDEFSHGFSSSPGIDCVTGPKDSAGTQRSVTYSSQGQTLTQGTVAGGKLSGEATIFFRKSGCTYEGEVDHWGLPNGEGKWVKRGGVSTVRGTFEAGRLKVTTMAQRLATKAKGSLHEPSLYEEVCHADSSYRASEE